MELFNQKSCLFLKPLKYTYMSFKKYIPVYIPTVYERGDFLISWSTLGIILL